MQSNETNKVIDWELALQQANGNQNLAAEMMKMLIESLPNHQAALEAAYQQKDLTALHDEVHKLYGALCYTGTPQLKKAAKELENSFQGKHKNSIDKLYQQLIVEIDAVKTAYQKMNLS